MEIAAPWARLDDVYEGALAAIRSVDGTLAASAHQSHAYVDGACLYFTFAGQRRRPRRVLPRGLGRRNPAVLGEGGALSHHHGVGLNRSRFVAEALGGGFDVLAAVKTALDPERHPQPGQARPAVAIRRRGLPDMSDLHWSAIWRAGVSVAVFLLPIAIVMEITRPKGAVLLLCFLLILFLAAVAGFGAAKLAPRTRCPTAPRPRRSGT